ncbi:prefoldin subunit 1-like isoform X1 [Patiria miniata]|uniref:Prefoldin subunit 1 n=1 Tax=Patiria miniata TaxID=46514 RepID=A0A914A9Z5_PATMI|nr:prefoldin subunit 1-like isoform X1 [Patiria miniata]
MVVNIDGERRILQVYSQNFTSLFCAFQELQIKMIDTSQQLKIADVQIEQLRRQQHHARLTDSELSQLPPSTRVYEGVGRMFLLQDIAKVKETLEGRVKAADDKIKKLQNNKAYLERTLKDSESNLREMVAQKQAAKS